MRKLRTGDPLFVDGDAGTVIVCPDAETLSRCGEAAERALHQRIESLKYRDLPAQTAGNKKLVLTVGTAAGDVSGEYDYSVAP